MNVTFLTNAACRRVPALALVALLLVQGAFGAWVALGERTFDFPIYYIAAKANQRSLNMYTLTARDWAALAHEFQIPRYAPPYRYPPFTAGLVSLFADLPYQPALILWTALSVLAVVVSGLALSQVTNDRWIDPLAFLALLCYVPIYTTLFAGQANNFVLMGVALYLLLIKFGRLAWAGIALATGIMVKPIPLPLLIHPFWRRDLAKIATAILGLVVVALAGIVMAGPQATLDYAQNALAVSSGLVDVNSAINTYPANQSLFGFFGRALTRHEFGPSLADHPGLARWLSLGAAGVLLLGVALLTWPQKKPVRDTLALETGLILVTINLIAPVSWYHHTVLSIIPVVVTWRAAQSINMRRWLVAAVVLIGVQGVLWHQLVGQTSLLSLGTYGMMIVYAVTLWNLLQLKRGPEIRK